VFATDESKQTQPTDAVDTAEVESPAPAEQPAAEIEPGRPSWEPEDGDFGWLNQRSQSTTLPSALESLKVVAIYGRRSRSEPIARRLLGDARLRVRKEERTVTAGAHRRLAQVAWIPAARWSLLLLPDSKVLRRCARRPV
jgi:hypothetical protein